MTGLHLQLLGSPALFWEGADLEPPRPKVLALLAYLALRAAPCERRDLSELLWETTSSGSLRVALSALRGLPGAEDWLETEGQLVRVAAASDVAAFEAAVREERWEEALEAWPVGAGPLLAGIDPDRAGPFNAWLEEQRARLEGARARARAGRLEHLERAGETRAALALAREILAHDPLDEATHRAVMRIEHGRGDTAAALAQFETLRTRLRDEMGAEPLPETLELLALIEAGEGWWRGRARLLRSADEVAERPARLLGRAAQLAALRERIAGGAATLLHGAGGMGKTALAAEATARWLEKRAGAALWVEAGDAPADELLDAVADALDGRRELARAADPRSALRTLLPRAGVGLVVLDDAWNGYALARVAEALPAGVALLASARQRYPVGERLDVGRLERGAAVALLGAQAGRSLIDDAAAGALCELLGDHAFALKVAGVALAARSGDAASVAALVERIVTAPHTLKLPGDLAEPGRESVAALLEVSVAALSDAAHEALMGIGALYVPSTTPELLARLLRRDANETEDALAELLRSALAERVAEAGSDVVRYRLHDLAYSLVRANSHLREATARRACLALLRDRPRDVDLLGADVANLLAAADAAERGGDEAQLVELMAALALGQGYFAARGHTPRSVALLRRAAEAAEAQRAWARAGDLWARIADHQRDSFGDYAAATELYRHAVALAARGGAAARAAELLSVLGGTRVLAGDDAGEEQISEARRHAERTGDSAALSAVLSRLATVRGLREDYAGAAALIEEALERAADAAERAADDPAALAGIDHSRFFLLLNLAVAEGRLERFAAAEAHLGAALELARAHGNEIWRAYAHHELGDLLHAAGDPAAARAEHERALELYDRNRLLADHAALAAQLGGPERGGAAGGPVAAAVGALDDPSDATPS